MAGARAIQIIVTVLLVATLAAVFVVAIGVFVTLTQIWEAIEIARPYKPICPRKRPPRDFEIP
jgi:hypothetical protein